MESLHKQVDKTIDPLTARLIFEHSDFLPSERIWLTGDVLCSSIIAKKGENLVRYFGIDRAPLITITGPQARAVKKTLARTMKRR
jgi:hypothetical protein